MNKNHHHIIKKGVRYLLTDNLNGFDTAAETLLDSESGARELWAFTKVLLLEHLTYDVNSDAATLRDILTEAIDRFSEILDSSEDLVDDLIDALLSTVTSDAAIDNRDSLYLTFVLAAILLEKTDDLESAISEAFEQLNEGESDE